MIAFLRSLDCGSVTNEILFLFFSSMWTAGFVWPGDMWREKDYFWIDLMMDLAEKRFFSFAGFDVGGGKGS